MRNRAPGIIREVRSLISTGTATGVTSSATIDDHHLVRGADGSRGVQKTGITCDDSDNLSDIGTIGSGAITSIGQVKGATGWFGGAAHYSSFEADGTLVFTGNATVWEDQQVVLGQVQLGSSAPSWVDYKGGKVLSFNKAQDNKIHFTAQLSHAYKTNSDLEFHIHIAHPDATAGDSRWVMTYSWASIGSAFPAESTADVLLHPAPGSADVHELATIDATITPSAGQGGISSVLLCSLMREGTHIDDDYDAAIYLVALDFHIECDTVGSRAIATK